MPDRRHPTTENSELYREVQPLHQNMIVRILVPLECVVMVGILIPVFATAANRPAWPVLLLIALAVAAVPALLLGLRMSTIVTETHLIMRYRPFPGRRVPIGSVRTVEQIRYNPLASGGWGWRLSREYHRVFNVSGDRGVYVVYGDDNSDRFLLGSRDPESLAEAIELARFAAGENAA